MNTLVHASLFATLLACLTPVASASPPGEDLWKPEQTILQTEGSYAIGLDGVCGGLSSGGVVSFHAVWGDYDALTSTIHATYARSLDGGMTWEDPVVLESFVPNLPHGTELIPPSIVAHSNGDVHLVWSDGDGIYYRRSTDNGDNWTEAPITLGLAQGFVSEYSVSADGFEGVHALWVDRHNIGGSDILFYKSVIDGAPGSLSVAETHSDRSLFEPRITAIGEVRAVWVDRSDLESSQVRTSVLGPKAEWSSPSTIAELPGDYLFELSRVVEGQVTNLCFTVRSLEKPYLTLYRSLDDGDTWETSLPLGEGSALNNTYRIAFDAYGELHLTARKVKPFGEPDLNETLWLRSWDSGELWTREVTIEQNEDSGFLGGLAIGTSNAGPVVLAYPRNDSPNVGVFAKRFSVEPGDGPCAPADVKARYGKDVEITWAPNHPIEGIDHYEIFRLNNIEADVDVVAANTQGTDVYGYIIQAAHPYLYSYRLFVDPMSKPMFLADYYTYVVQASRSGVVSGPSNEAQAKPLANLAEGNEPCYVELADFIQFQAHFDATPLSDVPEWNPDADIDRNGIVGLPDFVRFQSVFLWNWCFQNACNTQPCTDEG